MVTFQRQTFESRREGGKLFFEIFSFTKYYIKPNHSLIYHCNHFLKPSNSLNKPIGHLIKNIHQISTSTLRNNLFSFVVDFERVMGEDFEILGGEGVFFTISGGCVKDDSFNLVGLSCFDEISQRGVLKEREESFVKGVSVPPTYLELRDIIRRLWYIYNIN